MLIGHCDAPPLEGQNMPTGDTLPTTLAGALKLSLPHVNKFTQDQFTLRILAVNINQYTE